MKFRTLKEDEIECRVGQISAKGFTLLLYKNARVDMDLLDETVGAGNWQRDHKELKGNIYCGVSIWDETKKQWITKWDCGTESNTEKEKGEASDSFKRACVNVGIGRELYTSPFVWIAGNVSKIDRNGREAYVPTIRSMKVQEIGYTDDRKINRLVIIGDGEVIYEFGKETPKKAAKTDDANAYAWVLITAIADELRASKDEIYFEMLKKYGQGELISVKTGIDISGFVKYSEVAGYGKVNGVEFTHYRVYKGSSEYDTREMSIFIDGIVSEAQALGIDTRTPEELAEMKSLWENGK